MRRDCLLALQKLRETSLYAASEECGYATPQNHREFRVLLPQSCLLWTKGSLSGSITVSEWPAHQACFFFTMRRTPDHPVVSFSLPFSTPAS